MLVTEGTDPSFEEGLGVAVTVFLRAVLSLSPHLQWHRHGVVVLRPRAWLPLGASLQVACEQWSYNHPHLRFISKYKPFFFFFFD